MKQEDLDAMEKALEVPEAGSDDPRTDAPQTEAPGTTAPATKAPSTDAPKTSAHETEAPATDAPKDPRDEELRKLREEVEKLKGSKTEPPSTKVPSTEAPIEEIDFLAGEDLDDLTSDPSGFNKLLNKIYKKAREDTRIEMQRQIDSINQSIPGTIGSTISLQEELVTVRDKFYEENPDLLQWAKSVKTVMDELIQENPKKHYSELLPKVASEVRKRLGLKVEQKKQEESNDGRLPKLPRKKQGQRQSSNEPSDLDKQMDEMDKALGFD